MGKFINKIKLIVSLAVMCSIVLLSFSGCNKNAQGTDATVETETNNGFKYNTELTESPLHYAKLLCDTFMRKYSFRTLPPEGALFYHQGVLLSGMQRVYLQSGDKKYFDYIKNYIDYVTGPNGEIYGIDHELTTGSTPDLAKRSLTMLDSKQPVILMYNLYDETKQQRYFNSIHAISNSMYYWPVNSYGGYWHMLTQPEQMWLDSAYMAGPLSVMYSQKFGDTRLMERAIRQILIMDEHMKDEKTGLYYHGWDASKQQTWADKETGLSGQFWGRAIGWYLVAILDMLDYIPENHEDVPKLKQIVSELLYNLSKYQDKDTGMWYQVVDKPDSDGNWVESSATNLFIYSYAKAVRNGIVSDEQYAQLIDKAYKGSLASTYIDRQGNFVVDKVCIGTMIESGTYEHYITREQVKNDLHGGGAFILMCTEMENYYNMKDDNNTND